MSIHSGNRRDYQNLQNGAPAPHPNPFVRYFKGRLDYVAIGLYTVTSVCLHLIHFRPKPHFTEQCPPIRCRNRMARIHYRNTGCAANIRRRTACDRDASVCRTCYSLGSRVRNVGLLRHISKQIFNSQ